MNPWEAAAFAMVGVLIAMGLLAVFTALAIMAVGIVKEVGALWRS